MNKYLIGLLISGLLPPLRRRLLWGWEEVVVLEKFQVVISKLLSLWVDHTCFHICLWAVSWSPSTEISLCCWLAAGLSPEYHPQLLEAISWSRLMDSFFHLQSQQRPIKPPSSCRQASLPSSHSNTSQAMPEGLYIAGIRCSSEDPAGGGQSPHWSAWFESWLIHSRSSSNVYPGKQQMMDQAHGSLTFLWKTGSSSRLWHGPALGDVGIWGVNLWMEDLSVSTSLSFK